jgi:hypothetical protein
MGKTFEELTWEELCDLMCGAPEEEGGEDDNKDNISINTDNRDVGNRLHCGKV